MAHSRETARGGSRRTVVLLAVTAIVVFGGSLYIAWSVRGSDARRPPRLVSEAPSPSSSPGPVASPPGPELRPSPAGVRPFPTGKRVRPPADGGPQDEAIDPLQRKPPGIAVVDPPADMYDLNTPEFEIPAGGFAKWTGREGTHPKQVEMYARAEGTPLELALELRRLHWLTTLSLNFNLLMELRGGRPPGVPLEQELAALSASTWQQGDQLYEAVRAGTRQADEVRQEIRRLQDDYRRAYTTKAGITLEQMDQFYAPGLELP